MRYRRPIDDEDTNQDRWLISYADFITLLLAFFVVMYSVSQINESKYRVLSNTITEAFNLPEYKLDPMQVGDIAKSNPLNLVAITQGADTARTADKAVLAQLESGPSEGEDEQREQALFEAISAKLEQKFSQQLKSEAMTFTDAGDWFEISLSSSILFDSGQAKLDYDGESIVNDLAGVLFDFDNSIRVEGFTDNRILSSNRYETNWELSTARASAIVRQLVDNGIEPQRLAAVGYGEFQPLADNSTAEGRAKNRRVAFLVSKHVLVRPIIAAPEIEELPEIDEASNGTVEGGQESSEISTGVHMINLDSGGVLFTSDPKRLEKEQ